ncbi:MAG TPA: metallophosphoesterase [Candidatus Dojkabacteria bacterium]|nr:metallophosphoesterase [Candidatus Dojkabacteria bacterium]HRO65691.1 metallophosphoesterase [Candidatus Dojkabacteria bacterium]HRP37283.1 metallophosphoesterase [Candidatus Dojkabacteria bacterium]HRP51088.1 metallophosphoesterase [Candidatus Dojkabacteria bacterium]
MEEQGIPFIDKNDAAKLFLRPLFLLASVLSSPEYDYQQLEIRRHDLITDVSEPHKMVFMSDLHIRNGKYSGPEALEFIFGKIVQELTGVQNSGLLIGGDYINKIFTPVDFGSSVPIFPKLLELLSRISNLGIPIISVEGNHDLEHPYWNSQYKPRLQDLGVKFLTPFETSYIGEIPIIGIPDYTQPQYQTWHKLSLPFMRSLIPQDAKQLVFVAHHPDSIVHLSQMIPPDIQSLILTGHSHLSGYDMDYNWIANKLGRIALFGAKIKNVEFVKSSLSLRGNKTVINSSGLGAHPLHPPRRVRPDIYSIGFVPRSYNQ